jgi:hypothetical protein
MNSVTTSTLQSWPHTIRLHHVFGPSKRKPLRTPLCQSRATADCCEPLVAAHWPPIALLRWITICRHSCMFVWSSLILGTEGFVTWVFFVCFCKETMGGGWIRYWDKIRDRGGGYYFDTSQGEHFVTARGSWKLAVLLRSSSQRDYSIVPLVIIKPFIYGDCHGLSLLNNDHPLFRQPSIFKPANYHSAVCP